MRLSLLVLTLVAARALSLLPTALRHTATFVSAPRAASRAVTVANFAFQFPDEEDEDDEDFEHAPASDGAAFAKTQVAGDGGIMLTTTPAANLTVGELQSQLKQLGQRHTGTKAQLIERVQLMQRKMALGLPIHDMQVQKDADMQWYMLQTANGFERAVERTINMARKAQRLEHKIERVFVPILEGETSVRDASVMPSYIFVRMVMDENLHFLINEMQYVINFVGADRGGRSASGQMQGNRGFVRPMPMTDEAYQNIVKLTQQTGGHAADDEAGRPDFVVDDQVQVSDGPFKGMEGPVLEVDEAEQTLALALTVMGRDTAVTIPKEYAVRTASAAAVAPPSAETSDSDDDDDDDGLAALFGEEEESATV